MISEVITVVSAIVAVTAFLGGLSAVFWGARNKAIIETYKESNAAYKERNEQLEADIEDLKKQVGELKGRFDTLLRIKTPDIEPVLAAINKSQELILEALKQGKQ